MLHRRDLVRELLQERGPSLLAVAGLGSAAWDLAAAGENPRDFHFIGAMGQAAPFALGLSLAQPAKRVVLFTGDGDLLMGLGCLATIGQQAPGNLAIVVLDNAAYAETGQQPTATAGPTDLLEVAKACGFGETRRLSSSAEIDEARRQMCSAPGPVFIHAQVILEKLPLVFPPSFDGVTAINRFRSAILET